jgi:chromosome transmission fidelity protein 1
MLSWLPSPCVDSAWVICLVLQQVSGYTAAAVAKAGGSIQLQQHPHPGGKPSATAQPADDDTSQQPLQQQQQQQSLGHLSAKDGVSAIHSFISFILSLTHADADGRIIVEPAAAHPTPTAAAAAAAAGDSSRPEQAVKGGQLRYVLLNAAGHFGKLLASARSVLLVSGTLSPIHGLQAQLFPDVAPDRVRHFECGHVVPQEQLLAVSIGRGPSGRALNLKHGGRGDAAVMAELGQLLVNLCGVVPEGLVVFVPSFGYLEQLSQHWRASGLWERLSQRKQVFR